METEEQCELCEEEEACFTIQWQDTETRTCSGCALDIVYGVHTDEL